MRRGTVVNFAARCDIVSKIRHPLQQLLLVTDWLVPPKSRSTSDRRGNTEQQELRQVGSLQDSSDSMSSLLRNTPTGDKSMQSTIAANGTPSIGVDSGKTRATEEWHVRSPWNPFVQMISTRLSTPTKQPMSRISRSTSVNTFAY